MKIYFSDGKLFVETSSFVSRSKIIWSEIVQYRLENYDILTPEDILKRRKEFSSIKRIVPTVKLHDPVAKKVDGNWQYLGGLPDDIKDGLIFALQIENSENTQSNSASSEMSEGVLRLLNKGSIVVLDDFEPKLSPIELACKSRQRIEESEEETEDSVRKMSVGDCIKEFQLNSKKHKVIVSENTDLKSTDDSDKIKSDLYFAESEDELRDF